MRTVPLDWLTATAIACVFLLTAAADQCRLPSPDRKSTRLNSSHRCISYAVFCLKKKTDLIQLNTHTPLPPRYVLLALRTNLRELSAKTPALRRLHFPDIQIIPSIFEFAHIDNSG